MSLSPFWKCHVVLSKLRFMYTALPFERRRALKKWLVLVFAPEETFFKPLQQSPGTFFAAITWIIGDWSSASDLRDALVVDEEEDEEHEVCGRKCDSCDDVDGFRYSNGMSWFFFPHLHKATLLRVILALSLFYGAAVFLGQESCGGSSVFRFCLAPLNRGNVSVFASKRDWWNILL